MTKALQMPGKAIPGTNIRILNSDRIAAVCPGQIKHIFFDSDGTLSTLRAGWEKVMSPMMLEMIIGGATVDQKKKLRIQKAVDQYIDLSTGINTILQMQWLAEQVETYDLVPAEKILDSHGYKDIYNGRLMVSVNGRIRKVKDGELTVEQVTIFRVIKFLQLVSQYAKLHVFSGTDHDDVLHELQVIGVFKYMESVHGALREYKDSNKELILREAMKELNCNGDVLAVVGDGPVELKVGAEAGCLTIGVLSSEDKGQGWNLEKMERILAVEPHVIIPDFRFYRILTEKVFKFNK